MKRPNKKTLYSVVRTMYEQSDHEKIVKPTASLTGAALGTNHYTAESLTEIPCYPFSPHLKNLHRMVKKKMRQLLNHCKQNTHNLIQYISYGKLALNIANVAEIRHS